MLDRSTAAATLSGVDRKRLGQYFTGIRVARALATLARASTATSILDPMAGSGDMLVACTEVGAVPCRVGAVELDPAAAAICNQRVGDIVADKFIHVGSAFDPVLWSLLPDHWDLVITNPPYVRYQAGSTRGASDIAVPNAGEIRAGLIATLQEAGALGEAERNVFMQAARSYSGLSDLAVPSWILAASFVAPGGRLAVVVPDTWLSRDYAVPVVGILRRFFNIEYVVHDTDACWFDDALVRTTLVVARRVPDKSSALTRGQHLIINVPHAAGSSDSIVGVAFPGDQPEHEFLEWVTAASHPADEPVTTEWSDELDLASMLQRGRDRHPWIGPADAPGSSLHAGGQSVPRRLRAAMAMEPEGALTNLEGLGWRVGQGLRTGANDFFYVDVQPDGTCRSKVLPAEDLNLPQEVVRLAVRRQSDLRHHDPLVRTTPGILYLDGWALPEDITGADELQITGDLERLIRAADQTTYSRNGLQVRLPELSAVRTNARPGRCWYHLPPLAPRHEPEIFMARVNGRAAAPHLNGLGARRKIVDANFSTLWKGASTSNGLSALALLALLSSSWTTAYLEALGTVMGGGALKVEATHLRRLLLPKVDSEAEQTLAALGHTIAVRGSGPETIDGINSVVADALGISAALMSDLKSFAASAARRRAPIAKERTRHD